MPLREQIDGDKTKACSYLGWAKSKLFMLKANMKLLNIKQDRRNYMVSGARIFISSIFDDDTIRIVGEGGVYVFVADTDNHRIQVFDINGNFQFSFGEYGSAEGQFIYPINVDYYDNTLWISNATDITQGTIDRYSLNGQFISRKTISDAQPFRISVGENRVAVVFSVDTGLVRVYDLSWNVKYELSGITLHDCHGIEIADGKLFVSVENGFMNNTAYIKVFNLESGALITTMEHPTAKPYSYEGLAYYNGLLYGNALDKSRVDVFDISNYSFKESFDSNDIAGTGTSRDLSLNKDNIWLTEITGYIPLTGTVSVTASSTNVIGAGTLFTKELKKGAFIYINGAFIISEIINDTSLVLTSVHPIGANGITAFKLGDRIKKFNPNGTFIAGYGMGGISEGLFNTPFGIKVIDTSKGGVGEGKGDATNNSEDNLPYADGDDSGVLPGTTEQYTIDCGGCDVTWSVNDNDYGITIDQTGLLTIPESVPCGTVITITASVSLGFPPTVSKTIIKKVVVATCSTLTIVDEDGTPATDTILRNGSNDYKITGCCAGGVVWSVSVDSGSTLGGSTITSGGVLTAGATACGSLKVTATCAACGTSATQYVRVTDAGHWHEISRCGDITGGGCGGCQAWTYRPGAEQIEGNKKYIAYNCCTLPAACGGSSTFCSVVKCKNLTPPFCSNFGLATCDNLDPALTEYCCTLGNQIFEWICL